MVPSVSGAIGASRAAISPTVRVRSPGRQAGPPTRLFGIWATGSRARPDRRLLAIQRHDARPGDDVVDLGRGVAMEAEPAAGLKIRDAAGDLVGRRAGARE